MAALPNRLPGLDFGLGEAADMLRGQVEAFAAERVRQFSSADLSVKGLRRLMY